MTPPLVPSPRARLTDEDGVGVVSSVLGVLAFLTFLLFVVQVVLYLFTASVAQSAALDGATHGAGSGQSDSQAAARNRAEAVLGGYADDATVTSAVRSDVSGRVMRVTVAVRPPSAVVRGLGVTAISRAAEARIEE